jgi:hypothetical protein
LLLLSSIVASSHLRSRTLSWSAMPLCCHDLVVVTLESNLNTLRLRRLFSPFYSTLSKM